MAHYKNLFPAKSLPFFCALFAIGILVIPGYVTAQVTFSGTAASASFGSQSIGTTSVIQPLSFSIPANTTVRSIGVVTKGVSAMDFASASGSTCTVQTYSATTNCTVNVVFMPMVAGLRAGAVVFFSGTKNTGTVLGTVPINGIGIGPQLAFVGPASAHTVTAKVVGDAALQNPIAAAIDAAGNEYILDRRTSPTRYRLVTIPASGAEATAIVPTVNGDALYLPSCLAVDGAGDVYIGDFYGRIIMLPVGGGAATEMTPSANGISLGYPSGLALDGVGNLYVSDFMNNRVLELPAAGGAAIAIDPTVAGISLNDPHGLAVDVAGNLMIADLGNDRIVTVPAAGGAATAVDPVIDGESLASPEALAIDGAGDLFIADNVNRRVVELPAGGGTPTLVSANWNGAGYGEMSSVSADGAANLFIVEAGFEGAPNTLEELERSQIPALSFSTMTDVGSADAIDGIKVVQVVNVGNLPLKLTSVAYPADYSPAPGDALACAAPSSLDPGEACDLPIQFNPVKSGTLNESVTLIDNAMNQSMASQTVSLTGIAQQQAAMVSPAPGTLLPGPTVTFTWSAASSGFTWYYLSLGSTGVGSSNLYNSGYWHSTSATVSGIPCNGETIYARLTTNFNGVKLIFDYTYTAATQAFMVSPSQGAVLSGSSVSFKWTAAVGAKSYSFSVGSTGAGSFNVFNPGTVTTTTVSTTKMPVNGEMLYARLTTNFNGVVVHVDYTFTAATQP
jgi:sugar lactone lactonase YvrE